MHVCICTVSDFYSEGLRIVIVSAWRSNYPSSIHAFQPWKSQRLVLCLLHASSSSVMIIYSIFLEAPKNPGNMGLVQKSPLQLSFQA